MKMHFQNQLTSPFSGKYAHYHHKKAKVDNSQYCDIREFIKNHDKKWSNTIALWHSELCKKSCSITPFWWLIKGTRLYIWFPPIFNPLIFTIAVIEYCKAFDINEINTLIPYFLYLIFLLLIKKWSSGAMWSLPVFNRS